MPISPEQQARIDEYLNTPMGNIRGKCKLTVILQKPGEEDQILEEKLHPFQFWISNHREWTFAIADEPNTFTFKVREGKEPGYATEGTLTDKPEGYTITDEDANAIVKQHLAIYHEQYTARALEQYEASRAEKEEVEDQKG